MKEKIEEIIEKYVDEDCGREYYSGVRYDEEDNEFLIEDELKDFLNKNNVTYQLTKEYGFDSPGYSEDFLALAYLDESNQLQLETVILECF